MSRHADLIRPPTSAPTALPSRPVVRRACACGRHNVAHAGNGGECAECRQKRLGLQRRAVGRGPDVAPPIVHEVLRSPGRPLDDATRGFMESRFNHDFSGVRVHTDGRATESAQAVNALAYTVGNHMAFDAGQYAPTTRAGRGLLAHELTHVVQQGGSSPHGPLPIESPDSAGEQAAQRTASTLTGPSDTSASTRRPALQRLVRRQNVTCRDTGLTNPDLTGDEVVAAITAADAEAIELALRAELLLDFHLLLTRGGIPVDVDFDTILQEELGLTLTNPAHFPLIAQQRDRFRRVRETLESGYLRYMCRGGNNVNLIGCAAGSCGSNFAFACPGNRLVVLCQAFWENPDQRAATILHEPFHIWFLMGSHAPSQPRRADSSCFESFALRVAGQDAFASCVAHTNA